MESFDQPHGVPTPRPLILLVDDEPGVIDTLQEILTLDGYAVETAADGIGALERVRHHTYDLIVSDVYMPQCTGMEFYYALTYQYPHLLRRILFLTGDASRGDTQAFFAHTRAPLLIKPFSLDTFRGTVRRLLGPHLPQYPSRHLYA